MKALSNRTLAIFFWLLCCVACIAYRAGLGYGSWLLYSAVAWLPVCVWLGLFLFFRIRQLFSQR